MRLVTYRPRGASDAAARVGAVLGERVLDLGPGPMADLLADPAALAAARARVAAADAGGSLSEVTPQGVPLSEVALCPPVRPGKILCIGYNYRGHVPDGVDPRRDDPPFPDVFVKTPNVLAGPGDAVALPRAGIEPDYEGEIAVVIGARAHEVGVAEAGAHIAGYTLFDDLSDRAWQRRQSQWAMGKCFDGFGPLGPWIVTPDEVPDPGNLLVEVERDGVVTVSQSTATMVFSFPVLVAHLSRVMTLEPGDVISTGTPQKLPDALAAHRPLEPGDTVTVRVRGIGELTTVFTAPAPAGRIHDPARAGEADIPASAGEKEESA